MQKRMPGCFGNVLLLPNCPPNSHKNVSGQRLVLMNSFSELGLSDTLVTAAAKLGYTEPTPIQQEAIPTILGGADVIASAQTGTGKTAAFILPVLQRMSDIKRTKGCPKALVVSPTRELATQIARVARPLAEACGQKVVLLVGGQPLKRQIPKLKRNPDIVIATPGRLLDLMAHDHIRLNQTSIVVLDEADRMLDMGFWPSVQKIFHALGKSRQSLLFSATIPEHARSTIQALVHDPVRIATDEETVAADTVVQRMCPVVEAQKLALLEALIGEIDGGRVLVFCRTKARADAVGAVLAKRNISSDVMHADRRQRERTRALEHFRAGSCQVLVATDVMSRGIDVVGIDAVINFDVPLDTEDYVHRIGRTGRAGATGYAYTFVAPEEMGALRDVEYAIHELLEAYDVPGFDYDESRIVPNPARPTTRATRSVFSGSRGRGPARSMRYGRHY